MKTFNIEDHGRLYRVVNIHSLEGLRQSPLLFSRKRCRAMLHTHILHIYPFGHMPSAFNSMPLSCLSLQFLAHSNREIQTTRRSVITLTTDPVPAISTTFSCQLNNTLIICPPPSPPPKDRPPTCEKPVSCGETPDLEAEGVVCDIPLYLE